MCAYMSMRMSVCKCLSAIVFIHEYCVSKYICLLMDAFLEMCVYKYVSESPNVCDLICVSVCIYMHIYGCMCQCACCTQASPLCLCVLTYIVHVGVCINGCAYGFILQVSVQLFSVWSMCAITKAKVWCHSTIRKGLFQATPSQSLPLATADALFGLNFSICFAHHTGLDFLDEKCQPDFAWLPETLNIKDKLKRDSVTFHQTKGGNSLSLLFFLKE